MIRYILLRLVWMFIILLAFMSVIFIMIIVIQERTYYNSIDRIAPLIIEYFQWLKRIITTGNFGLSDLYLNVGVYEIFLRKLPVTIKLNLIAFFIYVPLGIMFGAIAAVNKNKRLDNIISLFTIIFASLPSFVMMFLVILLFGYYLRWFPTLYPAGDLKGVIQITGLVLPVIALVVEPIATITRLVRGELTEVLTSEHFVLARVKGLTKRQAIIRHGLRSGIIPVIPTIMSYMLTVFSGSLIVERIYSIPGTGQLFFNAITIGNFDYNMILMMTFVYTAVSLIAMFLVDLTYGIIDPRIRIGSRKRHFQ